MPLVDKRTDRRTVRYIGRCTRKGCTTVVSALIPVITTISTYALPTGGGGSTRTASTFDFTDAPGWLRFPGGGVVAPDRCGHGRMKVDAVRGIVTDHECDPRCEGATGPNCECACGGMNHGAAHV